MRYGTIYQNFLQVASRFSDNESLGVLRDGAYRTLLYSQLAEKVQALVQGFTRQGLRAGDTVAFMVRNGPAWVMIDLASAALGVINAPIHTTYGAPYIAYITEQAAARWLIIDSDFYSAFKQEIEAMAVERIVMVNSREPLDGKRFIAFRGLFTEAGASSAPVFTDEESVHTIIYTSGTTGKPRGVMLSHRNILSNVAGAKASIAIRPDDRFFSFLPLSHALERLAGYYAPLVSGAAIYYARDKKTMAEDIKIARPTILIAVPRAFEKIFEAIREQARRGPLRQRIFRLALAYGSKRRRGELSPVSAAACRLLDALVLSKIRAGLGGKIRFAVSGGAPLSAHIIDFFEDTGLVILEGYGLTEASPVVSVNTLARRKVGTVGFPLKTVAVKISGENEILVRGESVMRGYYQDEKATQEAIDNQGWLHTGDLGTIDEDGFITITGRKKEMIVLSTGQNVAPAPIEQALEINRFILQAMVYGDDKKHISAFIVPDLNELKSWASEQGIEFSLPGIFTDERTLELYQRQCRQALNHFPQTEQVRDFKLLAEEFTQENDMLTPTLKLKRKKIMEQYGA